MPIADDEARIRWLERQLFDLKERARKVDDVLGQVQQDIFLTRPTQLPAATGPVIAFSSCSPCDLPLTDLALAYAYNNAGTFCNGLPGISANGTVNTTLSYTTDPIWGGGFNWVSGCIPTAVGCGNSGPGLALEAQPFTRFLLSCSGAGTTLKAFGYTTNTGNPVVVLNRPDCTGTPTGGYAITSGGTRPGSTCTPPHLVFNAWGVTDGAIVSW